jgi:uncharacterized protein
MWYKLYTMKFEFNPTKSRINKTKHGIDFIEAQHIREDPDRIEIPAKSLDEPRWMVIGKIKTKHYSCILTIRGDRVRIISVRRARPEDVSIHES